MDQGIESVVLTAMDVSAYTVPTESPEADGTFKWNETTLVMVRLCAEGQSGIGFSFADLATAHLIDDHLKREILSNGLDIPALWVHMLRAVRNLGSPGVCSMAISAVDNALWDLKARLLDVAVADLTRARAPGHRGLRQRRIHVIQRSRLATPARGMDRAGNAQREDEDRKRPARRCGESSCGPRSDRAGRRTLFVDANGAYDRKEALAKAYEFADLGVTWFEEPVSSDDLKGLRLMRDRAPAGMRITAGEYGYDSFYFRRMLEAGAVDVLQADATRCAGVTGFIAAGHLSAAFSIPFSAHTAPSIHAHAACSLPGAINVEYFFDHYRIEQMFFDGALKPREGRLRPDASRPGFGLECKAARHGEIQGLWKRCCMNRKSRGCVRIVRTIRLAEALELESELRKSIEGEVRFDTSSRALYATDASNYRQVPIGVVVPKTVDDVLAAIDLCRRHDAPVLARGGGHQPRGTVLQRGDCSSISRKYLNKLIDLDPQAKTARVQPGIVLDWLRGEAERHQLTFGPTLRPTATTRSEA